MNVVIAAGGTGGHVFPAVALAEEFGRQDPSASITVIGTGKTLEQTMLAGTPFHLEKIQVEGVIGQGVWSSIKGLALIPGAVWQAVRVLRARCADLVIGTGGYTSPPVVIAAFLLGIRRALLEPNAVPGMANRVLGPLANKVFLSFEVAKQFFNPSRTMTIGVPIRQDFIREVPRPISDHVKTILVCGGSQGAQAINTAMIESLTVSPMLFKSLTVIHQTGMEDLARVQAAYQKAGIQATVVPFVEDMPRVLQSADLVLSRCGALTLAELAACGKPSILIPYPFATHHHQEHNARVMEQAGAAIVILQQELTGQRLAQEIDQLVNDPPRVKRMAEKSLTLRRTDSAVVMVRACLELVASGTSHGMKA